MEMKKKLVKNHFQMGYGFLTTLYKTLILEIKLLFLLFVVIVIVPFHVIQDLRVPVLHKFSSYNYLNTSIYENNPFSI